MRASKAGARVATAFLVTEPSNLNYDGVVKVAPDDKFKMFVAGRIKKSFQRYLKDMIQEKAPGLLDDVTFQLQMDVRPKLLNENDW